MFIYSTRRRAGRITKYIAKYWSKRLRKHPIWGQGGIGRVLADYYGREKPSSRYLWGIYGEEPIC